VKLTAAQLDRACGVLLGTAAGDALGAGYEFGPPMADDTVITMAGGGSFGWEAGEWTDDTSMAIAIAEVAATGVDLLEPAAQDAIVSRWVDWSRTAKDVGTHTRAILGSISNVPVDGIAAAALTASAARHARMGSTAGNGTLMRTAPVALAYLDDPDRLVRAAAELATVTHFDPEGAEACVLWCLAIRHAVLSGELDARVGLPYLAAGRASAWADRLEVAEHSRPRDFAHNGWVVEALQAAWCAIATTPAPADDPANGVFRVEHLSLALQSAVRGGRDTDTVAAIAGGLLGAAHGASAVSARWRGVLHGWPGLGARELIAVAAAIVRGGTADSFDFSYSGYEVGRPLVPHPYDDGLLLGDIGALRDLREQVDAVVSLCRVGTEDAPDVDSWIEVRLIDRNGAEHNPNLGFVLADTVEAIETLREAGKTVLLHCVQAQSRTPAVAALYGMRKRGVSAGQALADVRAVLPQASPIADFRGALARADGAAR
jgi:ADP-ribosyl-[dinitrogen reductase] hydrolase